MFVMFKMMISNVKGGGTMDLNIQKYLAFIRTVELGSLTKAADSLSYTQSGVSRMINDLEKEWKVSLLERSRSGVRLTSDGMKLLPYARNVCDEYQKLQIMVDDLNGLQSGLIRVATVSSFAINWMPNIIKVFQQDYPNIEYEILLGDYEEIENWILEGRVDCGFLQLPVMHPELESLFLEQDRLLVIMSKNHPLADCKRFPIKALEDYPFMMLQKGSRSVVAEILETYHIKPKVFFTTWDDLAMMSMAESGLAIGIVPELVLNHTSFNIVVKELEIPAYRRIGLVLRSQKAASLAVKRFIEYLPYRHGTRKLHPKQNAPKR